MSCISGASLCHISFVVSLHSPLPSAGGCLSLALLFFIVFLHSFCFDFYHWSQCLDLGLGTRQWNRCCSSSACCIVRCILSYLFLKSWLSYYIWQADLWVLDGITNQICILGNGWKGRRGEKLKVY